jgi:hypothetical protein
MYNIPLLQNTHASFGPHTALYSRGTGVLSWGVKQLEHEADQSPLSSVKVKNKWSCTYTPLVCLHGTDKDNFTVFTCNYKLGVQLTCIKNIMLSSQSSVFLTDITLPLL